MAGDILKYPDTLQERWQYTCCFHALFLTQNLLAIQTLHEYKQYTTKEYTLCKLRNRCGNVLMFVLLKEDF